MPSKKLINYTKEAFSLPVNLVFLSVALISVISLFVLDYYQHGLLIPGVKELVAFVASGMEMLYLSAVPSNKRFQKAVEAKYSQLTRSLDRQLQSMQMLKLLTAESLEKYYALYHKKNIIEKNLSTHNTPGMFMEAYTEKLAALEAYYVEVLYEIEQYSKYLNNESIPQLDVELQRIKTEMEAQNSGSAKVQDMYNKRIDLIAKRKTKILSVQENQQVSTLQLEMLQDTMNYLQEQSLTLKNPDEISFAIDSVLNQVEVHQSTIEDINGIVSLDTPTSVFDVTPTPNSRLSQ